MGLVVAEGRADQDGDEARCPAVGQPHLLAVDHVVVAVGAGGRRDGGDVGAQCGFGQRERAGEARRRPGGEVFGFLLVGAVLGQQVRDDEMGVDDAETLIQPRESSSTTSA